MRYLYAALVCLVGLSPIPAEATQEVPEQEASYLNTSLYCTGDQLLNSVLMVKVDMGDTEAMEELARFHGVSCKRLSKRELWFVEAFAFRATIMDKTWKVIFNEFRDDNRNIWYHMTNKATSGLPPRAQCVGRQFLFVLGCEQWKGYHSL